MPPWVLLSYRLPREPSRLRLAVWRRLRRLGAVVRHDALWLLPADATTREAFEWLAEEIEELGGTALTFDAQSFGPAQDRALANAFRSESDDRYAALADSARAIARMVTRRRSLPPASLQQARRQLLGLERALRLERRRDYFRAAGRLTAEAAIREAAGVLEQRLGGPAAPPAAAKLRKGGAHAVGH